MGTRVRIWPAQIAFSSAQCLRFAGRGEQRAPPYGADDQSAAATVMVPNMPASK